MSEAESSARDRSGSLPPVDELALSIGVALDLREVVGPFMGTARRLLELHSVHLFCHEHDAQRAGEWRHVLGLPDATPSAQCATFAGQSCVGADEVVQQHIGETYWTAIRLPTLGALVFSGAAPLAAALAPACTLTALSPVFERFTQACLNSLRHQRALDELRSRRVIQTFTGGPASHDELTELPNRKTLQRRLRQAVAAATRHGHFGAVFFIDVDRFKTINDTLGHAAGDAVLVALARRLEAAARDEDTLARVGGDEFILVASNLADDPEHAIGAARALAARLAADCRRPVDVRGANVRISTSMGICIFPEPHGDLGEQPSARADGDDGALLRARPGSEALDRYCENIIRFADTAMYRTKHRGRDGFEFFAPRMQAAADRRLRLEQQLRLALPHNEIVVHFQPLVTSFGAVIGAEALLRWNNAELGVVEPDEFIPVAEDSGLILEIGEWVIEQVCELVRDISASERYPQFAYISINVSPRQIKQEDFVDRLSRNLRASGAPATGVRLEITEHAAIDNIEDTIKKMRELNAIGILMSLDDFGTGYSSLSYLHRLPIASLKLDRTFVTSIADHEENQAIVDATIAMASHLGIECVPEGVEHEGDVAYFRSRPVHIMQGFYFSAALPAAEFLRVLEHGSLGPIADLMHQLPISWPRRD